MSNSEIHFVRKSWVLAGTFLIILYRFFSETNFSSIYGNPVLYAGNDFSYKLFLDSGISTFLQRNYFANLVLDLLFFVLVIGAWFAKENRGFVLWLLVWIVLYIFHFNLLAAHHYHGLIAIPIMLFAFLFKGDLYNEIWKLCRYYIIFIFSSAAIWKLLRGNIFYSDQMLNILQSQWVQFLVENPMDYVKVLLNSGNFLPACLLGIGFLLQLSFIAGFFTKRYDGVLSVLMVLFFVSNYFVMGIFSFEMALFLIVFEPIEKIYRNKLYPYLKNGE